MIALGNKGRSIDPDFWLKNLSGMDKIIVPDLRVIHEAEFFKERGAFLIRVESDLFHRSQRGVIVNAQDLTETQLDDYQDWDVVVENNSDLEALNKKADETLKLIKNFFGF